MTRLEQAAQRLDHLKQQFGRLNETAQHTEAALDELMAHPNDPQRFDHLKARVQELEHLTEQVQREALDTFRRLTQPAPTQEEA